MHNHTAAQHALLPKQRQISIIAPTGRIANRVSHDIAQVAHVPDRVVGPRVGHIARVVVGARGQAAVGLVAKGVNVEPA